MLGKQLHEIVTASRIVEQEQEFVSDIFEYSQIPAPAVF